MSKKSASPAACSPFNGLNQIILRCGLDRGATLRQSLLTPSSDLGSRSPETAMPTPGMAKAFANTLKAIDTRE